MFVLWPMDVVRGRHLAGPRAPAPAELPLSLALPPELLEGSRSLTLRRIEGHLAAVAQGPGGTRVWDLDQGGPAGPVMPLAWAEAVAQHEMPGAVPSAVLLHDAEGRGQVLAGRAAGSLGEPSDYAGPFPAYAFHYQQGPSLHLYVDALTGEVRQRRTAVWRAYDLAFRLHSLDMVPEGLRRGLMASVVLSGLAAVGTGLLLAWKRLRRRPAGGVH
jgi:hypothetical protein